jgi:predicted peroxiredoxin
MAVRPEEDRLITVVVMTDSKTKKLVVVLSHGGNDDKSSVAFTIANAALSMGTDVAIFLTSDAAELGRDGAAEFTQVLPFKSLHELIDSFVERGGLVWVCAPCYKHRGLDTDNTVEKAIVTGAGPLLEWVDDGASVISL